MNYRLNDKIINLEPYEPISGTYKIRLDANECPLDYPEEIKAQIRKAVDSTLFNRYPDPMATAVVNAFSAFYGISPELVTAGNGSDELIFLIESAFLEKGDRMLVTAPDFSMYRFYSSICEVVCDTFFKDELFNIDIDAMISKIKSESIKLVLFSNPCNPTGGGITAEEAIKLVSSVDALVIIDEAYMDFWDQSILDKVEEYDNLIVFRTASKAIGSAALRLGFAVANPVISRAIKAVKSPYNVNSFSQAVGEIIYNKKEYLIERQKMIVKNTQMLYNGLKAFEKDSDFVVYESKANFVFLKTSMAKEIWEYLRQRSIVIRLMGEYLRVTAGTAEEVEAVLATIGDYISEVRK